MKHVLRKAESDIRWGISVRLSVILLLLSIPPMLFLANYNLSKSQSEIVEATRKNLLELSRGTAHSINQLLIENQRNSATLAGDPAVVRFLAASEEERVLLAPSVYEVMRNFADTHPDYDAPGLLGINGIVIVSLADELVGKDCSFRDYFQASIQGEPFVSGILVGRGTGRPGVFLTNPIFTADGDVIGIDIIWLKAGVIQDLVGGISTGPDGVAYVVDQDGVIIIHPDSSLLYHSMTELTPEAASIISETIRFGIVDSTDEALIPSSLGMTDLASALASEDSSGICRYYSSVDERNHVAGFSRLDSFPWTVVIDMPETRFLAPISRLQSISWIAAGFVAVIVLIASLLLAGWIAKPIRRLAETAVAVQRNEPFDLSDLNSVSSRSDEIGYFSRVFCKMILALRCEIAERIQLKEKFEHLNLVLQAVRNVNQLITKEKNRDRLIQGACNNLVETRRYSSAWIVLCDESGKLDICAEAGLGESFKPILEQLKNGKLPVCCRTALEHSGLISIPDPDISCGDCPLMAYNTGKCAMTVRLKSEDMVYGLLVVSVPPEVTVDNEEESLLGEVAEDIGFALYSIELENRHEEDQLKLKSRERFLAEIFRQSTIPTFVIDSDHIVTHWNRALEGLTGIKAEQVVGTAKQWMAFYPGRRPVLADLILDSPELETVRKLFKNSNESSIQKGMFECEDFFPDIQDSGRWLFFTAAPLMDSDGSCMGVIETLQDNTEKKKAEEEIRRLNLELEQRVRERTAQLEVSNKELESFSYSVSHDLRAPLRSVDGFSQALLEEYSGVMDKTGKHYLNRVRSATQHMGKLIDDMLQLAHVSRGEIMRKKVNVSDLVRRITTELMQSCPDREIDFVIDNELTADADLSLLSLVLNNLFDNAIKFTKGTPDAKIEFGMEEQEGQQTFFVRDNGVGFDMKYVGKLFGAFQRLHSTEEFPGTGIGLATVKRIINRHGGRIRAEGEVGNGATFYFTL